MGKVNSHNMEKVWEKPNIPKLWVSQIFWVKQKSITVPNIWVKGIPIVREKYG